MKKPEDCLGDIAGLRRAIDGGPFDAVVALSPENVRYAGDVHISTQKSIRDRLALIVWAKGRDPVFVLCRVEEGFVKQESWIQDIRGYKEFVTHPMDLTADVLEELGLARGRIGIELDYLPASAFQRLAARLPALTLEPCDRLFVETRMRKTDAERALLRDAFRGTEKAFLSTYTMVQEGETEKSMAIRLADFILHSGADEVAFNHINAGGNTGFPHMAPSDYRVAKGDIVKADAGGFYREYYSNVGRTAKVGRPTEEEKDLWRRLREIHHEVSAMLRPGNTGRQLFERATRLHEKHDIPFPYAHNGHSIGLNVHEPPVIGPHDDIPFEAGMVCTVETRVRWVGVKGLHMEDLFAITEGAPVLLSDFFDNEEIFEI